MECLDRTVALAGLSDHPQAPPQQDELWLWPWPTFFNALHF
jgi:hypothetical protein